MIKLSTLKGFTEFLERNLKTNPDLVENVMYKTTKGIYKKVKPVTDKFYKSNRNLETKDENLVDLVNSVKEYTTNKNLGGGKYQEIESAMWKASPEEYRFAKGRVTHPAKEFNNTIKEDIDKFFRLWKDKSARGKFIRREAKKIMKETNNKGVDGNYLLGEPVPFKYKYKIPKEIE